MSERYRIEEEIARGGMGAIYRIQDLMLDRTLAMKVALRGPGSSSGGATASELELARFAAEARVTAQLDHPGVVPVHEVGVEKDTGRPFFTMKLVKGQELGKVFDRAQRGEEGWNRARSVGVLVAVCQTVAYAHSKGVVHRDLKPANVMVGRFGEVHVMDWGLAKVLGADDLQDRAQPPDAAVSRAIRAPRTGDSSSDDSDLRTTFGSAVGTPAYMSPEQARGDLDQVDARSDIYSLGAILYRMLTGVAPYKDKGEKLGAGALLLLTLQGPPTPVVDLAPAAPPELVAICEQAMAKQREERYGSCLELAADLQAWLDGRVVRAHATGAFAELRAWVLRNRLIAASLGVALLVACVGVVAVLGVQSTAAQRVAAERDLARAAVVALHARAGAGMTADDQRADAALCFAQAAALTTDPVVREHNVVRSRSRIAGLPALERVVETPGLVARIQFHPDGRHALLISNRPGDCRLLDVDNGGFVACPAVEEAATAQAVWHPRGDLLAIGAADGRVTVLSFPDLAQVASWQIAGGLSVMAFDARGELFVAGGTRLELRRTRDWGLAGAVEYAEAPDEVHFSGSGTFLVSAGCVGDQGRLRVFQCSENELVDLHRGGLEYRPGTPDRRRWSQNLLLRADRDVLVFSPGLDRLLEVALDTDQRTEHVISNSQASVLGLVALPEPDQFAVLGSQSLRAWDLGRRESAGERLDLPGGVEFGAAVPGLPLLLTAALDARVLLLHTPECDRVVGALRHQGTVTGLDVAPDGRRFLTAQYSTGGGLVRVWRLPSDEPGPPRITIRLDCDDNPANLSADGRVVLPAGWNSSRYALEETRAYDTRTGRPIGPVLRPGTTLSAAALAADGEMAALFCAATPGKQPGWSPFKAGESRQGRIHIVWSRTGLPIVPAFDTAGEPLGGAFRPDSRELAVFLSNLTLLVVTLPTGALREVPLPQQGIGISHTQRDRVRYSPDGSRAVTFAVGRGAQLWNTIDWTPLAILAETEPVLDALFSADGRLLATATSQGTARVWDPTTGSPLGPELEHPDRVFRGRFSPDGRHLFTACRDQFARLWDWRTGQLALNPLDHKGEVFDVGFTRDGRALLTCGTYALQSEVRSWSIDDGLPLLEPHLLPATCYSMLPTGDGRFVCGTTSGIEILDYAAAIAAIATAGSTDQLRRECELLSSRRLQADGNLFNLTGEELLELWRER